MKKVTIATLLILLFPAVSYACSCMNPFDVEKRFEGSSYVFNARVIETRLTGFITNDVGLWDHGIPSEYVISKINIENSWKGAGEELEGIITHESSASCGARLEAGMSYIFFIDDEWVDRKPLFSNNRYGVAILCGTIPTYSDTYRESMNWLDKKGEKSPNN